MLLPALGFTSLDSLAMLDTTFLWGAEVTSCLSPSPLPIPHDLQHPHFLCYLCLCTAVSKCNCPYAVSSSPAFILLPCPQHQPLFDQSPYHNLLSYHHTKSSPPLPPASLSPHHHYLFQCFHSITVSSAVSTPTSNTISSITVTSYHFLLHPYDLFHHHLLCHQLSSTISLMTLILVIIAPTLPATATLQPSSPANNNSPTMNTSHHCQLYCVSIALPPSASGHNNYSKF